MASSKGLRQRVSHALIASAGIFTLALAFWGVETYQQSQADIAPSPVGTVSPTSGTAPLTVTAKYLGQLPSGEKQTINFDELQEFTKVNTQYKATHGVTITAPEEPGGQIIGVSQRNLIGGVCPDGTEASSQPSFLLGHNSPITVEFDQAVASAGITLISVGGNAVSVTFYDANGQQLSDKTVQNSGDGACKRDVVSSEGASGKTVKRAEIKQLVRPGQAGYVDGDGYGIDDLTFTGAATTVQPVWTFGDGSASQTGVSVNYTYIKAGTYQVGVRLSDSDAVNAVATVTVSPATSDIPVTRVTTDKAKYALGEPITFNFHNDGPGDVSLSNSAPYTISQNGQVIVTPIGLQVISTLKAQEKKTWTWDQKLTNGQAAAPGTFAISVGYADSQGGKQATKTFDIESSTPTTAEVTLSTSKKEYALGETVAFTLRNVGPATIQLPNTAPFRILKGSDVVFVPTAALQVQTLAAGSDKTFTWDQKSTAGTAVTPSAYAVEVSYTVGGAPGVKASIFAVTAPGAPVPAGKLSVSPSEGAAPLGVKVSVTELVGKAFLDFGDGVITEVAQNATLDHTYNIPGTYALTLVDQASGKVLASASVKVSATPIVTSAPPPTEDGKGKGAPSVLASTGSNLLLILLIAALLSGLISYFIIRRPFHGGSK